MENFTHTFDITFNPKNFGDGFFSKETARLTVVLENVSTAQEAKDLLAKQGVFVRSISRLS